MTTTSHDLPPVSSETLELFRLFLNFLQNTSAPPSKKISPDEFYQLAKATQQSHHHEQEEDATFLHTIQESLKSRRHRRTSTLTDLRSYTNRILRYTKWHNRNLRSITRSECRLILARHFRKSPHVFCKAKAILHSLFAYGKRQGWCDINPIDGIESIPIREEVVHILTLRQIKAILKALEIKELHDMSAAVRLMLWCGVRPGEVQRLRWRDIDRREGVVYVDGQNSKTGGARAIPLRGGATQLKKWNVHPNSYIAPRNWNRQWARLRRRAGLHNWQRDAMRHSFASYHLKHFHNIYLLQEEMGHRDASLLRTRYLNLRNLSSKAACNFFKMS